MRIGLACRTGDEQCPCDGVFSFRGRDEREDAVGGGHDDVVAFGHPDQQRIDLVGHHGETVVWVTVIKIAGQRHAKCGVGAAIDETDPDSLARLRIECGGGSGDPPVDQVVGVGDVSGIAAEQVAGADFTRRPAAALAEVVLEVVAEVPDVPFALLVVVVGVVVLVVLGVDVGVVEAGGGMFGIVGLFGEVSAS